VGPNTLLTRGVNHIWTGASLLGQVDTTIIAGRIFSAEAPR